MSAQSGSRSSGGQGEESGEDEESSSSSTSSRESKVGQDTSGSVVLNAGHEVAKTADPEVERKARELFLQGVEYEQSGELFDAILKYKKAVQLVPDIEMRTFHFTRSDSIAREGQREKEDIDGEDSGQEENENGSKTESSSDLVTKFSKLKLTAGRSCMENKSTHILQLPVEILITILKWVVSSDLDLRSLENASLVCRAFYFASRSNDIWKPIFLRTCGLTEIPPDLKHNSTPINWRQIFLTRPRIHLDGCYIAKMSYIRQGERSFQDNEFYRSWHSVQHYRLIRFFAGGKMAMVTTAEEPAIAVKGLVSKHSSTFQGVMYGSYKVLDDRIVCSVRKSPQRVFSEQKFRRRRGSNYIFEVPEQDFIFELEIGGKRYQRLVWKSYSVISRYLSKAGVEQVSEFDVSNTTNFPPLKFSAVKSYISSETMLPLQ